MQIFNEAPPISSAGPPNLNQDLQNLLMNSDCEAAYSSKLSPPNPGDKFFPNIEHMLKGYNVFKGEPYKENDEGYKTSEMFAFNYNSLTRYTTGLLYPSEISVSSDLSCDALTSSTIMNDEKDL